MKVFTFEQQVLYPLSHLCSGVLDRNGGLVLRWHEQDVEEKRRAIAIDFIGLTFLEWILRPTGELSRYLLVCSAWDRIFALGVGIGARRKLQISGYTVLALDLKFKHGWDKKYLRLFLLGDDNVCSPWPTFDQNHKKCLFGCLTLTKNTKMSGCVHLESFIILIVGEVFLRLHFYLWFYDLLWF